MATSLDAMFFLCICSVFFTIKSDELQILLNLKTNFQNSSTKMFESWVSTNSICDFKGITCDSLGFVREIELSNQNLNGVLPIDSVCQIPNLEKLSVGFNLLYGEVTKELNNCVNLKYLDLGNNPFTGSFPDFSNLSLLQHLFINESGFTDFPWKSLKNTTALVSLSIGDNPLNEAQFPTEIFSLSKLKWIYMTNCNLTGRIPAEIEQLTQVENLELSENHLSGEIPDEIGNLHNLWQLELYNNNLTGSFPVGFRNLTNLRNFDASTNNLNGNLSELRFLTNLVSLQLFENELNGEIPIEFGQFKRLVNISLYTNHLSGSLPQELGSWAAFDFIDVSDNFLVGRIPPDMCKKGTMRGLLLLNNNFSGEIPASYANCRSMVRFRVPDNLLSGIVPVGIWGLPNLNIIDLTNNQFEGSISKDIGNAKGLAQLFVSNNRLSGELPEDISNATSLVSIELNDNQFSGRIPTSIGELKQLTSVHLQKNKFSGLLPDSLGSCDFLSDLNLACNALSGQIPPSFGSLPTLNSLNLSENRLSGEIPNSLSSLRLSLLDLSNNQLVGRIPQSLSIEAYNGSFAGNPGLCSQSIQNFRKCSPRPATLTDATLIVCLVIGSVILIASIGFFLYLKKKEKNIDGEYSLKSESWDVKSFHALSFTEEEILDSIKQENLIGKGGSGNVYRVLLSNDKELAVKHIWNSDSDGRKKALSTTPMLPKCNGGKSSEFDAEVQTLSSIRHVNVVKLYCSITSEDSSLLVYEYLPNGSLWDRLHCSSKIELDWESRYEIALGAAKGLEYLHHGCERPVIHRDVKSSNILLDEFLKPRIADFGLAKITQSNSNDFTQVVAGTHGYIAPEYGYTYKVNEKSDVYSFGVVLMELVTGKKPIEPMFGDNKDIVDWARSEIKDKESLLGLLDSRIHDMFKEDAIKVLRIALHCTATLPATRPTMRSVVHMLEEAEPRKLVGIIISKDGHSKDIEVKDIIVV